MSVRCSTLSKHGLLGEHTGSGLGQHMVQAANAQVWAIKVCATAGVAAILLQTLFVRGRPLWLQGTWCTGRR